LAYLRPLPNLVVMAPGTAADVAPMIDWALRRDGPTSLRYPKTAAEALDRTVAPLELGKADVLRWGGDGMLIACGTLVGACVQVADRLAEENIDFGVINARFAKPLDRATILRAVAECPLAVTVEEGVLMGGFGSAVLEAAADAGLDTTGIHRLGVPDRFIEHGSRSELLADLGLDSAGILRACRQWLGSAAKVGVAQRAPA
jgi:1-deoxy-D-xylulose-5-phosphate synthase